MEYYLQTIFMMQTHTHSLPNMHRSCNTIAVVYSLRVCACTYDLSMPVCIITIVCTLCVCVHVLVCYGHLSIPVCIISVIHYVCVCMYILCMLWTLKYACTYNQCSRLCVCVCVCACMLWTLHKYMYVHTFILCII